MIPAGGGRRKGFAAEKKNNENEERKRHPGSDTSNQTSISGVGATGEETPTESESAQEEVSGFVMETLDATSNMPSISGAPLMGIILVLFILIVIGAGFRRR